MEKGLKCETSELKFKDCIKVVQAQNHAVEKLDFPFKWRNLKMRLGNP